MRFKIEEILPEVVRFTRGGLYKQGSQAQQAMETMKPTPKTANPGIFQQAADVALKISEAPSRLLGTALSLKKGTPLLQTPAPFVGDKLEEATKMNPNSLIYGIRNRIQKLVMRASKN